MRACRSPVALLFVLAIGLVGLTACDDSPTSPTDASDPPEDAVEITIQGTVSADSAVGSSVEGATVTGEINDTVVFDVTTDSDGAYTATFETHADVSNILLRVNASDYESDEETRELRAELEHNVTLQRILQEMNVTFIDVGQGAAVLLDTGSGAVLFDAGRSSRTVYEYLQSNGISELDLIIASHAHADHIGGFERILNNKSVQKIWYNGQTHTTQTFEGFIDAALSSSAEYVEPTRGHIKTLGGLNLEVLHPTASAADYTGSLHDKNIVVRASYGDVAFMLTGDAEIDVEDELIAAGVPLDAQVLKMGHHGSRTSTGSPFVSAVNPEVAVYQASSTNQYGHPHAEALANVQSTADVYGSDTHGTIQFTTDGSGYTITTSSTLDEEDDPNEDPDDPEDDPNDGECIDLNSASLEELQEIVHIGASRAEQIVDLRPFGSLDELTQVNGISENRLDDIKEQGLACVVEE